MNQAAPEEDNGEPSVDSNDQAERIKARRLRIEKRKETKRKEEVGEERQEENEVVEELSVSRKQIEDSYIRLKKLNDDGFEMATNIRVAGDAREVQRRLEEEEAARHRKEKLEAEAKAGLEKFEDISKKWELALQKELAHDLHEMLMTQKSSCDAMLDEKNKLINDYQSELKSKDDQYVRDLKKEMEDIDLLIERINNLVEELRKAYRLELDEIERALVQERAILLEKQNTKLTQMMTERRQKELDYMKSREQLVAENEEQLHHQRIQDAEEYNQVKVKLETDVQLLQQQLQQMKATYQLNQEKLEYNFQVLKKRDEENTITKSQQKRKITRMHDILTNLKAKLAKQEKQYQDDNQQLSEDYKRITEQYIDLQKKSKHFMSIDDRKYQEIWEMKEAECKEHVGRVLQADKAIHEQQLGLPWIQPDVDFVDNVGPVSGKPKVTGESSAHELAKQIVTSGYVIGSGLSAEERELMKEQGMTDEEIRGIEEKSAQTLQVSAEGIRETGAEMKFSTRLIKKILELLCDESGFLLESKLKTLLEPLERCEQTLMKLDAIFSVLGIETEDDIRNLSRYFLRYTKSMPGDAKPSSTSPHEDGIHGDVDEEVIEAMHNIGELEAPADQRGSRQEVRGQAEEQRSASSRSVRSTATAEEDDDAEERHSKTTRTTGGEKDPQLIHPNSVLKALRAFVEDYNKNKQKDKIVEQFILTTANDRDETGDIEYWAKYPAVITKDKEKVWSALLESFEKYFDVLTSRSKLIDETDILRQQNTELRMLLHQYVNSKVNQELEIPPTRTMQLQLVGPM